MSAQPKPQLHPSGISQLFKCGIQFQFRYLEGRIIPPGVSMVTGTAVDRAVTHNLGHKIETGELLPVAEVVDVARDALVAEWDKGIVLTDEEAASGVKAVQGAAVDKSVRLAGLHATATAPQIEPTHVQRSLAVSLPGCDFDLVGTIDVQEGSKSVRDTKTSGKSPAADIADVSEQLTLYALMLRATDGKAPDAVHLDYLVDNKVPKAMTVSSTRTDADFRVELQRIETAARVIQSGAFTPAPPDAWWCSARFCGYSGVCPYFRRPVTAAVSGGNNE